MSQYFPIPFKHFGGNINVKVDLFNYAAKSDIQKPPSNKTSWRHLNDVSGTSQMKHPMTYQWNVAKTSQWYVSTIFYWNVVTKS